MKRSITIVSLIFSTFVFSQKKYKVIDYFDQPLKIHSLAFEFGGAAGGNWALGYEFWFRKGLHGFGVSAGLGIKGYNRGRKIGEFYNLHGGAHYTVGKWMGLRIGVNISGEINPGAYTGLYNDHGKPVSYPLSQEDEWALPGNGVRKWRTNFSIDIGPYFTMLNGEFYLYPKFSYGFFQQVSYWFWPDKRSAFHHPYGGLTMKFDVQKIHNHWKNSKNKKGKLKD